MKLAQNVLSSLTPRVSIPRYDRSSLKPGILHVGVGNFHRSHQAVYINDLLNLNGDTSWGIRGAGVHDADSRMRNLLSRQDWLYAVVEVNGQDLDASVVGALIDFVPVVTGGNRGLVEAMVHPDTKIVSLTVTEGGYFLNADSGEIDLAHPALSFDAAHPAAPQTVFGMILAALAQRKEQGLTPFTVMSCDNLPGNGDIAKKAVTSLARATDLNFVKWIDDNVQFPNGMVDRITPATSDREREKISREFGIEDNFPVFCEPFKQWVLEDRFTDGRPELEAVGVTFTDRIHDFEKMKIRMLNGGHAIMAYASAMLGIAYAHEAMAHPLIRAFLVKTLREDVAPFVRSVPGFTPEDYLNLICKRFENSGIADTVTRLCFDGSNRQPKFIVPSLWDNLDGGKCPVGLLLSSAIWCRYCSGLDENGAVISPNDPNWDELHNTARRAIGNPALWLEQRAIYGSLGRQPQIREVFGHILKLLTRLGTENTIKAYLTDSAFVEKIDAVPDGMRTGRKNY